MRSFSDPFKAGVNSISAQFKIGIDGRPLFGVETGIGRYVRELCFQLDKKLKNCIFFVYSPFPISIKLPSHRWIQRIGPKPSSIMSGYMWLKFKSHYRIQKDQIDAFWATRTLFPKLDRKISKIATIHDFNHLVVPRSMTPVNLMSHLFWFKHDVCSSDSITVNSKGTGRRLKDYFGIFPDHVIYPSVSNKYQPQDKTAVESCLNKYGVKKPYLLSLGTFEPRKNTHLLINAFAGLQSKNQLSNYSLVLVGSKGWKLKDIKKKLEYGAIDNVKHLGYIPEEDLPPLYSGSEIFMFPSIYEGFGIPVLEAISCGTRVVTSDTPELRESGGSSAIYTSPTLTGIQSGILQALCSPFPKSTNSFSWESSGEILAESILKAIKSKKI